MDTTTAEFLKKLINLIQKDSENKESVVVMVNNTGLSAHRIDLNSIDERIDSLINAVS
jgi:dihydroxyacetone kinase